MRIWVLILIVIPQLGFSQEKTQTVEMFGQLGNRTALLVLHASKNADGSSRLTGEYIVLPAMQRRFVDDESSPEIGVTTLREGTTPILFGREPTGELRGSLRAGTFKGMRYGPGGQERERFELTAEFPEMSGYTQTVHCDARDAGYSSVLIGEQHISKDPEAIGFDEVFKIPTTRVETVAPLAMEVLRRRHNAPLFLSVGFFETHREFLGPGSLRTGRYFGEPQDGAVVPGEAG